LIASGVAGVGTKETVSAMKVTTGTGHLQLFKMILEEADFQEMADLIMVQDVVALQRCRLK
jgi:hypothetical protein